MTLMVNKKQKKNKKQPKRNVIQEHNLHFATASIIVLIIVIFLPLVIDPLFNGASYDTSTAYIKISNTLIGLLALLAIYSGYHGLKQAKRHLHWSVYVTALTVGILSFIQFLWLGLPAIFG
jgi:fumarate reductase subunit D